MAIRTQTRSPARSSDARAPTEPKRPEASARSLVQASVRQRGEPLDGPTRLLMEGRFGTDFSDVRLHTDPLAAAAAAAVRARAYTLGSDIVVAGGRPDFGSPAVRRLLAHELAHVIQQRSGRVHGQPGPDGLRISHPNDRFERRASELEAGRSVDPIPGGNDRPEPVAHEVMPVIQRLPDTKGKEESATGDEHEKLELLKHTTRQWKFWRKLAAAAVLPCAALGATQTTKVLLDLVKTIQLTENHLSVMSGEDAWSVSGDELEALLWGRDEVHRCLRDISPIIHKEFLSLAAATLEAGYALRWPDEARDAAVARGAKAVAGAALATMVVDWFLSPVVAGGMYTIGKAIDLQQQEILRSELRCLEGCRVEDVLMFSAGKYVSPGNAEPTLAEQILDKTIEAGETVGDASDKVETSVEIVEYLKLLGDADAWPAVAVSSFVTPLVSWGSKVAEVTEVAAVGRDVTRFLDGLFPEPMCLRPRLGARSFAVLLDMLKQFGGFDGKALWTVELPRLKRKRQQAVDVNRRSMREIRTENRERQERRKTKEKEPA